jgi:hypothetical protein
LAENLAMPKSMILNCTRRAGREGGKQAGGKKR